MKRIIDPSWRYYPNVPVQTPYATRAYEYTTGSIDLDKVVDDLAKAYVNSERLPKADADIVKDTVSFIIRDKNHEDGEDTG